jgi:uncharacterized membrane protein YfcA
MIPVMGYAWFIPIGFLAGAYGTLIGAGGGFVLVPLLLFLSPSEQPAAITATSFVVILLNAASGTAAYARMKRIGYKTGILFALATIPGAVAGSALTVLISRKTFGLVFGALLIGAAAFLIFRQLAKRGPGDVPAADPRAAPGPAVVETVIDREGNAHALSYDIRLGMGLSFLIGLLSSLIGIGGGIIHVPLLTYLLGFPLHIATATSHFILMFTALAAVVTHILNGTFPSDLLRLLFLAIGVVPGAQLGALVSRRVSTPWIVVGLAAALGLVGIRLIAACFS